MRRNQCSSCSVQPTHCSALQVEDALGLLLPEFTHIVVRGFAVATLARATDEDLLTYLLQVCALLMCNVC